VKHALNSDGSCGVRVKHALNSDGSCGVRVKHALNSDGSCGVRVKHGTRRLHAALKLEHRVIRDILDAAHLRAGHTVLVLER
jgi:hypothetical protein